MPLCRFRIAENGIYGWCTELETLIRIYVDLELYFCMRTNRCCDEEKRLATSHCVIQKGQRLLGNNVRVILVQVRQGDLLIPLKPRVPIFVSIGVDEEFLFIVLVVVFGFSAPGAGPRIRNIRFLSSLSQTG